MLVENGEGGYEIFQTHKEGITESLQDCVHLITHMVVMSEQAKLKNAPLNQDNSLFCHLPTVLQKSIFFLIISRQGVAGNFMNID